MVVSSQGPASEAFPLAMGLYTVTPGTHMVTPVWRSRHGIFLFNGNDLLAVCDDSLYLSQFSDNLQEWRLFRKDSAETVMLRNYVGADTEVRGSLALPTRGWQYQDGGAGWTDDETIRIQGRRMFYTGISIFKKSFISLVADFNDSV